MLVGIQILGILFGLFMTYFTYLKFKRQELGFREMTAWIIVWVGLMFVTLFPTSLNFFVKDVLSMKRPLDFYIICGFLFITLINFYNYAATKRVNQKMELIVRSLASNGAKNVIIKEEEEEEEEEEDNKNDKLKKTISGK
jgi:hypothetical protein